MAKMLVIHVDGHVSEKDFSSLESLQEEVGGFIEWVNLDGDCGVYVNEEGKLLGLPVNPLATKFIKLSRLNAPTESMVSRRFDDFIIGPMVVCGNPDGDGNDTSVPEKLREKYINLMKEIGCNLAEVAV